MKVILIFSEFQVTELESQADHLRKMTPDKTEEIEAKKLLVAKKFESIIQPLEARKKELLVKKEVFQFMRDVEDENIWIEEKMTVVTSEDYGSSLQVCHRIYYKVILTSCLCFTRFFIEKSLTFFT